MPKLGTTLGTDLAAFVGTDLASGAYYGLGTRVTSIYGAKLKAWYLAHSDNVVLNGAAVSQLNDISGNGLHLTQATAANQPTWSAAGGPGGTGEVQFDGTDDVLSNTAFPDANGLRCGLFVVGSFDITVAPSSTFPRLANMAGAANSHSIILDGDKDDWYGYARKTAGWDFWWGPLANDTLHHLFGLIQDSAGNYGEVDGSNASFQATMLSNQPNDTATSIFSLGAQQQTGGTSQYGDCNVNEAVVLFATPTAAENTDYRDNHVAANWTLPA